MYKYKIFVLTNGSEIEMENIQVPICKSENMD